MLKIDMIFEKGCYPEKAHPTDAGFDLKSNEESFTLEPGTKRKVSSGIKLDIPSGYVGVVAPRSGLGTKFEVVLANTVGIIDAHYTGEVSLTLTNKGKVPIDIAQFDRVAQLLILPVPEVQFLSVQTLKDSTRGAKGHGSTGK
jgi:dUTP pyrophosphatase